MQNFSANKTLKFSASQILKSFAKKMFNIVVIKNNLVNVVNISMNFNFKIDIDYDFRN